MCMRKLLGPIPTSTVTFQIKDVTDFMICASLTWALSLETEKDLDQCFPKFVISFPRGKKNPENQSQLHAVGDREALCFTYRRQISKDTTE